MTLDQDERPSSARHEPTDGSRWRRRQLIGAGFDPELATAVAGDDRFDLHALMQLVDRGCPPHLAVRIMSPLPSTGATANEMGS